MKVSDGVQKRILWDLFFAKGIAGGQLVTQQREVDLADLIAASGAKKKLKGTLEGNKFNESEVEFTVEEASLLSKFFKEKKQWPVDDADGMVALQEAFGISKIPTEK